MNFFTQLHSTMAGTRAITLKITKTTTGFTVGVLPEVGNDEADASMRLISMSGTAAELDEAFINELSKPITAIESSFISNAAEVATEVKKAEADKETEDKAKAEASTRKANEKQSAKAQDKNSSSGKGKTPGKKKEVSIDANNKKDTTPPAPEPTEVINTDQLPKEIAITEVEAPVTEVTDPATANVTAPETEKPAEEMEVKDPAAANVTSPMDANVESAGKSDEEIAEMLATAKECMQNKLYTEAEKLYEQAKFFRPGLAEAEDGYKRAGQWHRAYQRLSSVID